MYGDNVAKDNFNISLDGYEMIMEEVSVNEGFNRRETIRHNILGGTQSVMRGNYLPRDYTFTTHFLIDPNFPDVYDSIIREWQSKPVEVISRYMGGKFKAEVIIKKTPTIYPNYLSLEIQVIEIPSKKSLIPNEEYITPKGSKTVKTITKTNDKDKNKNKGKNKGNGKKNTKKNTKKNDTKRGKNGKKKGSNITSVK